MGRNQSRIDIYKLINDLSLTCLHLPNDKLVFFKLNSAKLSRFSNLVISSFSYLVPGETIFFTKESINFLKRCTLAYRKTVLSKLNNSEIPLIVLSQDIKFGSFEGKFFSKLKIPVFQTSELTSSFESIYSSYIEFYLTKCKLVHGVLLEIYGTGVLITGRSGVGKSEYALELIKKGHRFVSDDAVEIKKMHTGVVVGVPPSNIRNFLELRGVGIVDIKTIFGVSAVKYLQKIDLIIELVDWSLYNNKDRLFVKTKSKEIFGVKIPLLNIPVNPGRSVPSIIETAVMSIRGKSMGYDATKSLIKSLKESSI